MKISIVTTAFALCTSTLASPALEGRAISCNNADINTINSNKNSPCQRAKKTASYHKLKATAVSGACTCITASATACTAKTHTVTETNILTIKSTETKWKTKTETKISTAVQSQISISTKTTTPTGCKVVSCAKSTITSIATATVMAKCSQTCAVRSCPRSVVTSTAPATTLTVTPKYSQTCPLSTWITTLPTSTVVSMSTVNMNMNRGNSISAVRVSTVALTGEASTVTQYSTISICSSSSSSSTSSSSLNRLSASGTSTSTSTSALLTSTICTTSDDLLVNGDFESGSLSPWSSNVIMKEAPTTFIIASPGYNSNNAIKAEYQSSEPAGISISQTFATIPGTTYDSSFRWMMNNNHDDASSYIWCKNADQSFSNIVFSYDLGDDEVDTWVLANDDGGKLVAEDESTTIECQMVGYEGTTMWIDDIYLGCDDTGTSNTSSAVVT